MNRKLPDDAFEHYVGLGLGRSYQAVAEHYGVSKVAVTNRATQEDWQGRLARLEGELQAERDKKAKDALEAVRERQLKAARLLQARALQALQSLPPEKGIRCANALSTAWKHELLLLGEPSERIDVWEQVRREQERWLAPPEDDEEGGDADDEAA